MYAMQYQISLPADYDMQIIRDRVTQTGHLMDGYPGLEFKAYLIQEKTKGAPRNAYAPFYLWRDIDGMRQFCWGEPGYSAIVRDFGRHPIHDWTVHQLNTGPADYSSARSLTVTTVPCRSAKHRHSAWKASPRSFSVRPLPPPSRVFPQSTSTTGKLYSSS